MIITITGPSGSGKSSLERALAEHEGYPAAVSYTSRPPREGEVDGQHYHFRPKEIIEAMIEAGKVVEHAWYNGNLYALTRGELEKASVVVAVVDRFGLDCIRATFDEVFSILLLPENTRTLRERMRARGDSEDMIAKRMALAATETALDRDFDLLLVSDFEPSQLAMRVRLRMEVASRVGPS